MADDNTNQGIQVKREKNRIECTVTFSEAEIGPAEQKALEELGKDIKMEGFREGKVPADMLREKVDPGALMEATIRHLLPDTFDKIAKENDIKPVIPPNVEALNQFPLQVKITFIEKPEVKLKGADKIKVEKKEPKLDNKDVERMLEYILNQHKTTKEVEREAKEGDQITMDFWGQGEDGEEIPDIRSEDYQVVIGSKSLIPGFEDNLIGKKAGDTGEFQLIFPEKYHAEKLQNKPVTFHATIKKVEEVDMPELDDELAKKMGANSAEEFKKQVEESMLHQEEDIERKRREQVLFDAIENATQVDLFPELIDDETRALLEELQQQLSQQGLALNDWIEKTGKKPEEIEAEMKSQAEKRLTLRLGMQKLVEEKNIELTDEEMEHTIAELFANASEEQRDQYKAAYAKGEKAYEQLKWQKKVERVIEHMLS